jgi:hypothetical protein
VRGLLLSGFLLDLNPGITSRAGMRGARAWERGKERNEYSGSIYGFRQHISAFLVLEVGLAFFVFWDRRYSGVDTFYVFF